MDDHKRKLFDKAVHDLELEFGVSMMAFTSPGARDEAKDNLRIGLAIKSALVRETVNELPC